MKQRLAMVLGIAVLAIACMPLGFAQGGSSVGGVVKDDADKPVVGATLEFTNLQNGRKYSLKTNNKGEYYSLGIDIGTYSIVVTTSDGRVMDRGMNFRVAGGENKFDSDLKSRSGPGGVPSEEMKKAQEEHAKAVKENDVVKVLNEKLKVANEAMKNNDFETAITTMNEAVQLDGNRDLLWFKLADAYRGSASKQTDVAEKSKRLETAITDYHKAIDMKEKAAEADPKTAKPLELAIYYNNMGTALGASGKAEEAGKAFAKAAELNPAGAAQYYFNMGAILTNAGKTDDALGAFDKAIAADPTKADAYYQKGVTMLGKATLKGDKMVAPEGTAEAFNKYLELAPTGPYADTAKQMLASIGASVETDFGKKKAKK